MTPEAQRIAIAEACGWKWSCPVFGHDGKWRRVALHPSSNDDCFKGMSDWAGKPKAVTNSIDELPDYLNDLNAIDLAVRSLNPVQQYHYSQWLDEVTEPVGLPRFQDWSPVRISHATAAQRAEAFLRTIRKRVD